MKKIGILFIALSVCVAMVSTFVHSEHVPSLAWMRSYKDANGLGCCSDLDCKEAVVSLLLGDDTDSSLRQVIVNGVQFSLARQSVHASETAASYWCYRSSGELPSAVNTRCVFYAIGG